MARRADVIKVRVGAAKRQPVPVSKLKCKYKLNLLNSTSKPLKALQTRQFVQLLNVGYIQPGSYI